MPQRWRRSRCSSSGVSWVQRCGGRPERATGCAAGQPGPGDGGHRLDLHKRSTATALASGAAVVRTGAGGVQRRSEFGQHPAHIADYPIQHFARRTDNFVDFTYRNDQNGWDGIAYSADGSAPHTVQRPAGDHVIASAKLLGAHWFAFQSYHMTGDRFRRR
jgi:hypothetical protein